MEKIQLNRLQGQDAPQLAELANNKKIWDNLRDYIPYPYRLKDAQAFIEMIATESPAQTFGIFTEQGELCGVIGLVLQGDVYQKSAELGYWLGEAFWGKGIVTEAIRLITQYGFETLALERIYAGVFEFNIGSMRALEKNGYRKEGVSRNAIFKNNRLCDEHRFAKLKNT